MSYIIAAVNFSSDSHPTAEPFLLFLYNAHIPPQTQTIITTDLSYRLVNRFNKNRFLTGYFIISSQPV